MPDLNIWMTTFNCAEKLVDLDILKKIFTKVAKESPKIDMVVLGLQESHTNQQSPPIAGFTKKFSLDLGLTKKRHQYLWIYIRDNPPDFSNNFVKGDTNINKTGIAFFKKLGGKGGLEFVVDWWYLGVGSKTRVGIERKARLVFITTHLNDVSDKERKREVGEYIKWAKKKDPHVIFIMGDLNYRIKLKDTKFEKIKTWSESIYRVDGRREIFRLDTFPADYFKTTHDLEFPPPAMSSDFREDCFTPIYPSYNRGKGTFKKVESPRGSKQFIDCYVTHVAAAAQEDGHKLKQDDVEDMPYNAKRQDVADMGWLDRIGYFSSISTTVTPVCGADHNNIDVSDHMPVSIQFLINFQRQI